MDERKYLFFFGIIFVIICLIISIPSVLVQRIFSVKRFEKKAAIIDGLKDFPNQHFILEAKSILSDCGYLVDYYPVEEVNVRFFKKLPSMGYTLIILRVHCGPLLETLQNGASIPGDNIVLFTTEEYSTERHVNYQLEGVLARGKIVNDDKLYFAIPPVFVSETMQGAFMNTTIILDSCYGLYGKSMPEAFLNKGAQIFIGWDGEVTANHTDDACLYLLEKHCLMDIPLRGLIKRIKPDPIYGSSIKCYPP